MSTCLNCGGLIMKPGVAYGYAGPVCHCPIAPERRYQNPNDRPLNGSFYPQDSRVFGKPDRPKEYPGSLLGREFEQCGCIGPQHGQPLCPCQMRGVIVKDGRYVRIIDLGPVHPLSSGEPS